jgi:hypothetical protein
LPKKDKKLITSFLKGVNHFFFVCHFCSEFPLCISLANSLLARGNFGILRGFDGKRQGLVVVTKPLSQNNIASIMH